MLLSLSLVAAAVKSHALAPHASIGCSFVALSPYPRFQKSGLIAVPVSPLHRQALRACGIRM
jgi:hypothetical protein